jgi:hypothetical protein
VGYERLDGSISPLRRSEIASRFNDQNAEVTTAVNDEPTELLRATEEVVKRIFPTQKSRSGSSDACDIRILLMTTRSCGHGLNLTAADTVILIEHDWNPFMDMQVS